MGQVLVEPSFRSLFLRFLSHGKMNGIERANIDSPAEIHLKVHEIPLVGVDHDFPRLQYLEVLFD